MATIIKSFSYDSELHTKCHFWVKQQDNFSKSVRRLIEKDMQRQEDLEQIQKDISDLRKEIQRLKISGLAQPEQAEVLEIEAVTEAIAEQPAVQINLAALKNRYKD